MTLNGGPSYNGSPFGDGTIFSIQTDGSDYKDLYNFSGPDGELPEGSLILSGSTLYGTTSGGGAYGDGTVFALNLNPTPEPSTFALLGAGVMGLLARVWRRCRTKP